MMRLCGFEIGLDRPLFLIAGPCVIESESLALDTAGQLKEITARLGIPFIYKSSFDKANRSSHQSYRGPGLEGLRRSSKRSRRRSAYRCSPTCTNTRRCMEVAAVADVLQTPAASMPANRFHRECRPAGPPGQHQEEGQFLAPWDMRNVVTKARMAGNDHLLVCERGVSFGYNNLVSDMRAWR